MHNVVTHHTHVFLFLIVHAGTAVTFDLSVAERKLIVTLIPPCCVCEAEMKDLSSDKIEDFH